MWSLASGTLYALDPATGHTRASIAVGSLPHFASPTRWDGLVFVGTMAGVFAVTHDWAPWSAADSRAQVRASNIAALVRYGLGFRGEQGGGAGQCALIQPGRVFG
jgi:hypothetical protein